MGYRIAVDIGGTFTDCVVADGRGTRTVSKALTTPAALERGVLEAVRLNAESRELSVTDLLSQADAFVHGTTQATNAIITRTGARCGLLITQGFEDTLIIGRGYSKVAGLPQRDMVHASRLSKPEPIIPRGLTRGITERVDAGGNVVIELDEDEVVAAIDSLVASGVEALAVCLLWSFANSAHELRIKALVEERAPSLFAAYSHEIAPIIGEYERAATTALAAYVGPKMVSYVQLLESRLNELGLRTPMLIMQASGGLTSAADAARRSIVTLDSGPTGGILGAQFLGRQYGEKNVICTDVGGTSFDVGLILNDRVPLETSPIVGRYALRFAKVLVNTIGAGGGSIAWIDAGGLLRVGPQSASSQPGPACYGLGGEDATVTDADLVLGYLDPASFLGGRMELKRDLAVAALAKLGAKLGMGPEEAAIGIFKIINAQMADLIRQTTVELGHDPRDCVLAAYGGAGPTHALFYGHDIGVKSIIVPINSTAFSAEGMLTCDISHDATISCHLRTPFTDDDLRFLASELAALEQRVINQFADEGIPASEVQLERILGIQFRRQVHVVDVGLDPGDLDEAHMAEALDRFSQRYAELYGRGAIIGHAAKEVERIRVVGTRPTAAMVLPEHDDSGPDPSAAAVGQRSAYFEPGGFVDTTVFDGTELKAGNIVSGPAIIERTGASVIIPPGYRATVDRRLNLLLDPAAAEAVGAGAGQLSAEEG